MKKLSYVFILALLCCLLVFQANATDTHTDHCVCAGGYEHSCENITWQPLPEGTVNFGLLESGNYYLTADVQVTANTRIQQKNITLCLNGHNITTSASRVFGLMEESTLTITDCSHKDGAWSGTVTGGNGDYGQILYTNHDSTVNIYGGNFTRQANAFARDAGLFCIAQDNGSKTDPANRSVMNIYNGNIYGGKAGFGGNIYSMHCGQVNMYGGQLHDGIAQYIKYTGGEHSGMGGNVYIGADASFNLYGGKVYGGIAAQGSTTLNNAGCGGNFSCSGTLNIYGGEIYDGIAQHDPTTKTNGTAWNNKTPGRGGNIFVQGSRGVINMSGGKIWGGQAYGIGGGNILVDSGHFNLSGGMIWGGIANADKDATKSAALVNAYDVNGGSVRIHGNFNMTGGSIGINDRGEPAGGTCYPSGSETGNVHITGESYHSTISGGVIAYGNTWLENGKEVHGGISKGGNLGGISNITVTGTAVIRDGYASIFGGNWALYNNGLVTISGGTISGGRSGRGGNIMVDGSNTTAHLLTITGGTITGGIATNDGGNICVKHANKGVKISGGAITNGTAKEGGNFSLIGTLEFDRTATITGGKPAEVMVMDGGKFVAQYATVSAATAALKNGQYLRLTGNLEGGTYSCLVDLAGNSITNAIVTEKAAFMDSATDGYNSSKAGTLTVKSGTVQSYCYATESQTGANRLYITAENAGSYTFQRYYMAIDTITIKPSTLGMGYKATFKCSEELQSLLSPDAAFGYRMWITEDLKIVRGFPAEQFTGTKVLTLRIDHFLDPTISAKQNEDRANMQVYACPYIQLADGTIIEGVTVNCSLKQMLEKVNDHYSTFSNTQKVALSNMSKQFPETMMSWDISNFHHTSSSYWISTNTALLNATLKTYSNNLPSGNYVLTENVNVGSRTIIIPSGNNVTICLNGHTLTSSTRLFKNYGNLNLCDCHKTAEEGYFQSNYTVDSDNTDGGEYVPIIYCYATSVTNLYGGKMKALKPVTFAGVVAVSHDNNDKTLPAAVFNMYGGTIYGNTVTGESAANKTASGGAVSIWNGGTFNMYGGTATGGNATTGGLFSVASNCTLNIYDGTITGGTVTGTATTNSKGGNILNSGTLNIYGGLISGGTASAGAGGNIYSSGVLNMYGGTVTGGIATAQQDEFGDDIYNTGVGGGIFINSCEFTGTGNAVIEGNSGSDLYIGVHSCANIQNLVPGAKIGISSDYDTVLSANEANKPYLFARQAGKNIYTANGKVVLGSKQPASFSPVSQFSVGYNKTNISTTQIGLTMSPWGNPNGKKTDGSVGYDLYATTVAITDKQNTTVLMITLDLQSIGSGVAEYMAKQISLATDVPVDHIYISTTHTHNCPSLNTSNARYYNQVTGALVQSAISAMSDRAPATMQTGSFETQGMNFTRNYYYYLNNDTSTEPIYCGDQYGIPPQNGETRYRVREGDHTMHLLAFNRTGKQPILVVNWRAHPHRSGGMWNYSSDADVIGATRENVETNTDYLFAYFQGAAGNMNTVSSISGETYADRSSAGIKKYGVELCRQIVENGLLQLKPAETGLIQTVSYVHDGAINHDDEIYWENAQRLIDYHKSNPDLMDTYLEQITEANTILPDGTRKYEGVYTVYHAQQIVARHNAGETRAIPMNVFSIGNSVAFCTSPAESWDRVSEELEGLSPFEMTFFIGYCDGSVGYMPYGVAGNYPSYEYYSCVFKQDDVIKEMIDIYVEFLEEQYINAQ